jgi:DNA repair ATPase RecN
MNINGPTFEMGYVWLVEQLTDVQEKVTTLFNEIKSIKESEGDIYDSISEDKKRLVVMKFELLNRQIGRGLMIVEIFNKFGSRESPFKSDLFDKMISDLTSLSVTGMSNETNEEDPDHLENMEKKIDFLKSLTNKSSSEREELIKNHIKNYPGNDTKDDTKNSPKGNKKGSNNFIDQIRKKFSK